MAIIAKKAEIDCSVSAFFDTSPRVFCEKAGEEAH